MKMVLKCIISLLMFTLLTACSTQTMRDNFASMTGQKTSTETASSGSVGGNLQTSMDEIDRNKMFHALESAPGKSTHWENAMTNVSYTVTPVKKVVINGNKFCREYQVNAVKGSDSKQYTGTACIGADGNWKSA